MRRAVLKMSAPIQNGWVAVELLNLQHPLRPSQFAQHKRASKDRLFPLLIAPAATTVLSCRIQIIICASISSRH